MLNDREAWTEAFLAKSIYIINKNDYYVFS